MFFDNLFIRLILLCFLIEAPVSALPIGLSETKKEKSEAPIAIGNAKLPSIVENTSADKILGQTIDDLFSTHFIFQHQNFLLTKNFVSSLSLNSINEYGSSFNFAALLGNGGMVTWEIATINTAHFPVIPYGKKVVSVTSNDQSFAILFDDGTVGFSDATNDWLIALPGSDHGTKAIRIFSNRTSFAVLLNTGKIFCWGDQDNGGNTPIIPEERRVRSVIANDSAFAAILDDGSVQCWGNPNCGGLIASKLKGKEVDFIVPASYAFAAVFKDGTLACWGDPALGGELPTTFPQNKGINSITANIGSFAALFKDGSIQCWGDKTAGGATPSLDNRKKILSIIGSGYAFTALFEGGSLLSWGDQTSGGTTPQALRGFLTNQNVVKDAASFYSFTAILANQVAWYWGLHAEQGKMVTLPNKQIISVTNSGNAFTVLFDDGTIQSWGDPYSGGITPNLAGKKVASLVGNFQGFLAVLDDGTLHSWGGHIGSLGEEHLFDQNLNIEAEKNVIALISPLNKVTAYQHDRLTGIAVVGNSFSDHGAWQYLECGSSDWKVIPPLVSDSKAFLIDVYTKLRFVPDKNFYGTIPPLLVRLIGLGAEVQTGSFLDVSIHGGSTSYSNEAISLNITIKKAERWFWWWHSQGHSPEPLQSLIRHYSFHNDQVLGLKQRLEKCESVWCKEKSFLQNLPLSHDQKRQREEHS